MRIATALAALGVVLIGAAPANASVARVRQDPCFLGPHGMGCENGPTNPVLEYVAGPGESNVLAIAPDGAALVVTDSGATVQAQAGCTQLDAHSARCTAPVVEVRTGDGADRVDLSRVGGSLDSGEGNDEVSAGVGFTYTLGPGDDRLTRSERSGTPRVDGGAGNDTVRLAGGGVVSGDDGNDTISTGEGPPSQLPDAKSTTAIVAPGRGNDVVSAGAATDEIFYGDVAGGRRIDLSGQRATVTASSEVDRISGFESATGGKGDDVIVGTSAANRLQAGAGNNRIEAAGGADELVGGSGRDTLLGGPGKDTLQGFEGDDVEDGGSGNDVIGDGDDSGRDRLRGGPGRDTVFAESGNRAADNVRCGGASDLVDGSDRPDRVARDCERVAHANLPMSAVPRRSGASALAFHIGCPRRQRCRAVIAVLGRHRRRLGRRRFAIPGHRSRSVRVRVPAGSLRRGALLSVVVLRKDYEATGHSFRLP